MKSIDIYIDGIHDSRFQLNILIYYLSYKDAVIKRVKHMKTDSYSNYNMLQLLSLYEALKDVKEPCIITVHSKKETWLNKPKRSLHKDLIAKIQLLIINVGHILILKEKDDFHKVDMWEQVYGTKIESENKQKYMNSHVQESKNITKKDEYKPDISNANTANEVFSKEKVDWKKLYDEALGDGDRAWVGGMGGY